MTATERLAEIKARAEAATEGPWIAEDRDKPDNWGGEDYATYPCADIYHRSAPNVQWAVATSHRAGSLIERNDATFIAHARTDVPALVAALEAVLALDTGDNRRLYGNDFEAGMAKALWLAHGAINEALGGDK